MEKVVSSFTVLFEEPFWIGLYERTCGKKLEVCKITFGPEPKDYEVYEFLQKCGEELRFSPPVSAGNRSAGPGARVNPKRRQRQISKQLKATGIGTKAQQALALQHEEGKQARSAASKEEREREKERRFQLKQEKRKQKHKGK